jgi:hypothetical protein
MYRHISEDFPVLKDIHIIIVVQEGNGKEALLDDEFIRHANQHTYSTPGSPPVLRINARVMSLKFSLSRKSVRTFAAPFFFVGRQVRYKHHDPNSVPWLRFSHLSLTARVEEGDEIW